MNPTTIETSDAKITFTPDEEWGVAYLYVYEQGSGGSNSAALGPDEMKVLRDALTAAIEEVGG